MKGHGVNLEVDTSAIRIQHSPIWTEGHPFAFSLNNNVDVWTDYADAI